MILYFIKTPFHNGFPYSFICLRYKAIEKIHYLFIASLLEALLRLDYRTPFYEFRNAEIVLSFTQFLPVN